MKKYLKALVVLLSAAAFFVGCASAGPIATWNTRNRLQNIEIGMTKDELLKMVGKPYSREAFLDEDGTPIEFLLYQTSFVGIAGTPGDQDLMPVAVKNGRVIGYGRNFYDRTQKYQVDQNISIKGGQ